MPKLGTSAGKRQWLCGDQSAGLRRACGYNPPVPPLPRSRFPSVEPLRNLLSSVRDRGQGLVAAGIGLAVLMLALPAPGAGARHGSHPPPGNSRPNGSSRQAGGQRCVQQHPQRFLVRENYLFHPGVAETETARRSGYRSRAVQYRVQEYGSIPGIADGVRGTRPVTESIVATRFMGHSLRVHKRIVKPLGCVENAIRRGCTRSPYEPKAVGGFRDYNSYRGDEVSNHAFGIAIDLDPDRNPCCHCVAPWPDNPRCKIQARTPFDRMAMPRCWVQTFERFGFYWLGHDQLEDTMHFEFLGNPDRYGED